MQIAKKKLRNEGKRVRKKNKQLEEGDIFSIPLSDDAWTIAQLCNLFTQGSRYVQYTLAFFNYKFGSELEVFENILDLDLSNPICIATTNGHPLKDYGLKFVDSREVAYENARNFKDDIHPELGLYRLESIDFMIILRPFFGIIPWDSYYKDDFVDELLLDGVEKRDDVTYMKDFSLAELKRILPPDNLKLNQLL